MNITELLRSTLTRFEDAGVRTSAHIKAMLRMNEMGGCKLNDLSNHCGVSTAAITGTIDKLERLGLARRSMAAHDRRAVMASLTAKGERVVTGGVV